MGKRIALCGALFATAAAIVPYMPAQAQISNAQPRLDLPAQSLSKSLSALGRKMGTEIAFSPAVVDSRRSPALSGNYSLDAALRRLLAGSGLRARRSTDGAYVIEVAATANPIYLAAAEVVATHADPVKPAAPAPLSAQDAADIVVTGSRLITIGNNSPTPLTVATTQQLLEAQPAGVIEGLNSLPGLLGSLNTTTNAKYNTLNLRGIGGTRALVLYDGHRVGPTQANGTIDVDVIPQVLLQRVDVVTGGASAVYGSDAVSGVVNFVTDTKFDGFKANIQNGISTYGDDRKTALALAYGREFAGGRGHIEVGYEYHDNAGVLSRSDRPYFNLLYSEQGTVVGGGTAGTATNPYKLTAGAVLSTATFRGLINTGPLAGLNFTRNSMPTAFVHGAATGTTGVEVGGDGAYYTGASVVAPERLHRGFARLDYDVTDSIHAHVQAAAGFFKEDYTQRNLYLSQIKIGYNNAFLSTLPAQYQATIQAQLKASATSSFSFSKMETAIPDYTYTADETYYMADAGLDGRVGKFHWNVDYYHTGSSEKTTVNTNVNAGRLYAALNAVVNPATGQTVCNAALVNPSAYGNCVPLNLFGPTSESQAAIDYIEQATHSKDIYNQDDVSATLTGALFDLPAGPLSVALNGEYRKLSYRTTSDAQPTDVVNCTGIQFNCTATTSPYVAGSIAAHPTVSQTVTEGAIETDIPILSGLPFAKSLTINAAARFTHYDTSGSVWTWKVGGDWQINDSLTLRATRSRDIRAPNLTELFAPASYAPKNFVDIHTGASGTVNVITQGNPNLTPEKANTITAGFVIKPQFLRGFSFSADYYRIRIHDAIVVVDPFQPSTEIQCEGSGGTSPVCALYDRPFPYSNTSAANYPTALHAQSLNVASLKTYGVDFEANYRTNLLERPLALRLLVNWQPHLIYNNGPTGIVDVGGAADGVGGLPPIASVKAVGSVAYDLSSAFRVFVQERWRAKLKQNGTPTLYFVDGDVPAVGYTDLTLTYVIKNTPFTTFFNVQNLFNKIPPPFASAGGSVQPGYIGGNAQGDDIEGRILTVGVKLRF